MERLDKIKVQTTKTTDFILPLLGYPKNVYEPFLVNAYLNSLEVKNTEDYTIQILLRFYSSSSFDSLERKILSLENFKDSYELFGGKFIMYIVSLPEWSHNDFDMILNGRYSKISDIGKNLICQGRAPNSSMPKVLKKCPSLKEYWEEKLSNPRSAVDLRDQEVWPILNFRDEIFDKDRFPVKDSVF